MKKKIFSQRELDIIKIIGRRKVRVKDIAGQYFAGREDVPFDMEISIANSIRRIIEKCEHYSLSWTLVKFDLKVKTRTKGKQRAYKRVTINGEL